ncbi:hypothetical protein KIH74_28135 [Kineosporia sp. J2-2]|uniref:Uncharacterized protein n=1 Tax=Kineosporia corallincola TaxID=2835133 RepID=A0ABS5TQP9_9ACTN|nr:hypothetical protein [Kineosporia corallincola]MBT0772844.1 hypothetical protein [Kineosporia corallincola]
MMVYENNLTAEERETLRHGQNHEIWDEAKGEWVPYYPKGDDDLKPTETADVDSRGDESNNVINHMVADDYDVKAYGEGSGTSVNTAALADFSAQMTEYIEDLTELRQDLIDQKKVAAGGFPSAIALNTTVETTRTELVGAIGALIETFVDLQAVMKKIGEDYKTLEEVNAMAADKFTTLMSQVKSDIGLVGTAGGS